MIEYPKSFDHQFVISPLPLPETPHAAAFALPSIHLQRIGELPVIPVLDGTGRTIGAFLGYPIDLDAGRVVGEPVRLAAALDTAGDIDDFIEHHIYRHSGSFLFILDCHGMQRVYLDADGSMSLVFDKDQKRCAATTGLLLDPASHAARFEQELYDFLDIRRDGWFPAGLTAHRGIERLICNHYLDLKSWECHRHWPRGPITITDDPDAVCAGIVEDIGRTVHALIAGGPTAATLTAGNETRLILAACRDLTAELDFVTIDGPEVRLDAVRAGELAKRFKLRHRYLPIVMADDAGAEQWHARSSHCIGGANMRSHPTIAPLHTLSYFIGGLGGEIGRGFFWRPTDTPETTLNATDLAVRFGMPQHPRVIEAVENWLKTVPKVDALLLLDLAYLELRMSCWAFAQAYATTTVKHIHPLISRRMFAAMLSLPPEWRRNNRMITRGVELAWPELLEFPINRYGDYRDQLRIAKRAFSNPRLVIRKLRKRFG